MLRKLILISLVLAAPLRAQTAYTPPVLPPWQSVADTAAAAQQMVDLQTFITAETNLLLAHDQAIFNLQQQVAALQTQVTQLQAQVNAATPPPPIPTPAVIVQQAEAYSTIAGGGSTCAGGTGTVLCFSVAGETLTYAINVHTPGNYKVSMSVSSTVGGTITINGIPVTTPNTGSFNAFQTVQGPVLPLVMGANTITVVFTTAQQNIDFFTFTQQ